MAATPPYPPALCETTIEFVEPPDLPIVWVASPTPASENVYLTDGGLAADELAVPLAQSEEGGDVVAEGAGHSYQDEQDEEEVVVLQPGLVRLEADHENTEPSAAEAWLGPAWQLDNESVTTAGTVTTEMVQDSFFADVGSAMDFNPEIGSYHADEYGPSIEEELRRSVALVLNAPHSAYNWIGLVTTTPFPWHTS